MVGFIYDDQAELSGDFVEFAACERLDKCHSKWSGLEFSSADHACLDAEKALDRFDGLA